MRYAIIGSGMMGQEHIENLKLLDGVEVVALADPDPGMLAQAAAAVPGQVRTYADHRELLAAGGVDALLIVSPNHTHVDVLGDALGSGLPILVEKPLCTTVEDCDRVIAQARGRQAPVWVAMEYRYMPPVARLIEEVRAGTVGHLAHAGDPRASLSLPGQGRQLEPLRPELGRHAGREVLPFLRPDAADHRRRAGPALCLGRPGREPPGRGL